APSPTAGSAAAATAGSLDFTAIDPVHHDVDEFIVPEGYSWRPIVRWGDPLFPDAPRFDPANQSPESHRLQYGSNNDYLSIRLDSNHSKRAALLANQESTNDAIMYPDAMSEADERAITREAHGLTVLELARTDEQSTWKVDVNGANNRRFLIDTEY